MFLFQLLRVLAPRFPSFTARSAGRLAPSTHGASTVPDPESKPNQPHGRRDGRPQLLISTLNPAFIQSGDYMDLSGRKRRNIGFTHALTAVNPQILYVGVRTFPDNCAGFLYYHRESTAAPLEGGIRFRRTRDNRPSSFSGGHDLLLPSGAPWELILPQLTRTTYQRLGDQLLRENLATPAQFALCRRIFATMGRIQAPLIMFRLTQEFPVNFGGPLRLTVVGSEAYYPATLELFPVFKTTTTYVKRFPLTGSAIARFEPSARDGRRVLHLRIVKIIKPVVCTVDKHKARLEQPEEGQLLTGSVRGCDPAPWEFRLDGRSKAATAFRALWDVSPIP
ncbi:hypothetical protein C8F04DRAFT_1031470 [Mycena alexandri]|uniref:Uncharacterized protein n=1 Tax=Mycena alexandri TaxID=1745969 RepID=A0AAD6XDM8_9AGAR|nr:hypothetical protein C8F04DRAFT_1031470 [Mycena alexandri]